MTTTRLLMLTAAALLPPRDGKLVPPRDYQGSLEERAQEAIIVFTGSKEAGGAIEDLILKITVQGEAKSFAWVVPFPEQPEVDKADARMFRELFEYVEARQRRSRKGDKGPGLAAGAEAKGVEVLERRIVGSYDVASVREKTAGALNEWLVANGYQKLDNADDVLGCYRNKGYVFACIKVSDAALRKGDDADLHPLRFTFKTGGRDGIYFPMKMTGLQTSRFDVNLHVFDRYWINDRLSRYGYVHRGFALHHRDWDTPRCERDGGKAWSDPTNDAYLRDLARLVPTVTSFMQARHPGKRFYLTTIQARGLAPDHVRSWKGDLWLFPYYTDPDFVPYDARPGGCAADAYE